MTLNGNTRINYLDGLRAVAVTAVVVYHNNSAWLPGGFIGVEIFFVISGFIITKLLYSEFLHTGKINIPAFYLRRLRRLMPTIFAVILTAWVYALVLAPDALYKFWLDLPYAFLSALNWHYILTDQPYFYYMGRPRILEHLWSLSVEFQFYLLWPFICILLFRINIILARTLIVILALLSSSVMAYQFYFEADTIPIYFGTHTRASAFLLGSLAALSLPKQKPDITVIELVLIKAIASTSILFLIFLSFNLTSTDGITYYGGFFSISVLTAFTITSCYVITCEGKSSILTRILECPLAKNIGVRSYAIYMWHWPVICFFQPVADTRYDGTPLFFYHILVTLILSELSFRIIEKHLWAGYNRISFTDLYDSNGLPSIALVSIVLFACFSLLLVFFELTLFTEQRLEKYGSDENHYLKAYQYTSDQALDSVMASNHFMDENKLLTDAANESDDSEIKTKANISSQTNPDVQKKITGNIPALSPVTSNNISNRAVKKFQLTQPAYNAGSHIDPAPDLSDISRKSASRHSVLLIGDSVMSALSPRYSNAMQNINNSYWSLRFQAGVCRRLTTPGCLHGKPESALSVLRNNTDVYAVVIMIGHNDDRGAGFRRSISQITHELSDIPHVFWLTMREVNNSYSVANSIIKEESASNKNTRIIDWAQISKNQDSWVAEDGTHLTAAGARNMASIITMELKSVEQ
jgi:peptidoglycan/LPS O-acetylase OafA/YrhL